MTFWAFMDKHFLDIEEGLGLVLLAGFNLLVLYLFLKRR